MSEQTSGIKKYLTKDEDETKKVAVVVLREAVAKGINLILLKGDLGMGKTIFAQGVLGELGAEGPFTSPTFVIMKRYSVGKSQITNHKSQVHSKFQSASWRSKFKLAYHLDCYRVGGYDILELGWREIIDNKHSLVLVEWPEKIWDIIPVKYCLVDFEMFDFGRRKIMVSFQEGST